MLDHQLLGGKNAVPPVTTFDHNALPIAEHRGRRAARTHSNSLDAIRQLEAKVDGGGVPLNGPGLDLPAKPNGNVEALLLAREELLRREEVDQVVADAA